MHRIWIVAGVLGAVLVMPSTVSAHPTQQREIVKLKRQAVMLRKQAVLARAQRDAARELVAELRAEIADAKLVTDDAAAKAAKNIADLTTARDAALAGLPDAIRAVPENQFLTLVLSPARSAYRCSSYYSGEGYWSYTFTRPAEIC